MNVFGITVVSTIFTDSIFVSLKKRNTVHLLSMCDNVTDIGWSCHRFATDRLEAEGAGGAGGGLGSFVGQAARVTARDNFGGCAPEPSLLTPPVCDANDPLDFI